MAPRAGGFDGESLAEAVERLDAVTYREMVVRLADEHVDVARAVRLAVGGPSEQFGILRAEVDRVLRTRRHLDYRESSEWAKDAWPVLDALDDAVESAPSAALVELLERAVGHVVKVILRADDSNGMIGDVADRLLALHRAACEAGVADPVKLARWMARFSFDDQDFFVVDPVAYAGALGERGLAVYRSAMAGRSAGADEFALLHAMERLAVLDGDVERVVDLLGGDLRNPHQFIRVTEAMLELGRADEALMWASRGIAETAGWQVGTLYDLAVGIHGDRGEADAVLALRREQHTKMPSASTYSLLRAAATELGVWENECGPARAALFADPRGLVEALLSDGDIDGASSVAATAEVELDIRLRRRLAEAREPTDPAGAMTMYLAIADTVLLDAGKAAYRQAARDLKTARRAAVAADCVTAFEAHLASLRDQHRRRPTFISVLDKAGLP